MQEKADYKSLPLNFRLFISFFKVNSHSPNQGWKSTFPIFRNFLLNHGRILPALTYNGSQPLNYKSLPLNFKLFISSFKVNSHFPNQGRKWQLLVVMGYGSSLLEAKGDILFVTMYPTTSGITFYIWLIWQIRKVHCLLFQIQSLPEIIAKFVLAKYRMGFVVSLIVVVFVNKFWIFFWSMYAKRLFLLETDKVFYAFKVWKKTSLYIFQETFSCTGQFFFLKPIHSPLCLASCCFPNQSNRELHNTSTAKGMQQYLKSFENGLLCSIYLLFMKLWKLLSSKFLRFWRIH